MTIIRVQERTSVEDILKWNLASCKILRLGKRSGFEPGAQGVALSTLSSLRPGHASPILDCDFEEPTSLAEFESTLLGSAFGFALTRLTSQIQFAGKSASDYFKSLLGDFYKIRNGVFGSGTSRSVVCPDPVFSLPPVLAQPGIPSSPDFFPPPSAFASMLNNIVEEMGFRKALASTEESNIVSFVYEALRNSWEHGLAVDSTRRARSTRALIVEKIVLHGSDPASRHLSDELKQYLERIVASNPGDLGLGVLCLTVADQGDGIQATLPVKEEIPEESASQRLARAFIPGESRKPAGVVKRGLGLPSVISAAYHLQAFLRIASGNLVIGQDFSIGDEKYPRLNFGTIKHLPDDFVCGTSVSIFVPEFAALGQRSLFSR